ncbi:MAG TPA: NAD(P)/FAD-dependent oxidoreductase [Herpetosiphonaceae bacterium]
MTKVAIVGGGFTGLSAAYDLARRGLDVTVFEAAPQVGGLAAGFRAPGWDWSLEKFYHHIFQSDAAFIDLIKEIGAEDLLFFNKPVSGYWDEQFGSLALDGALPLLRYPHLPLLDRVRTGVVVAWLKWLKAVDRWQPLEDVTAEDYLRHTMGDLSYEQLWRPLFEGKFGPYAGQVNAAWFWARIASRTPKLGYFRGGFQAMAERLAEAVRLSGGTVRVDAPVQAIMAHDDGWLLSTPDGPFVADAVLSTTSPGLLRRMTPSLPANYAAGLDQLKSIGALVLTIALDRSLTNGTYWMNMDKGRFPVLALVEHTQMIDRRHYGGQHLVYLGDYLEPSHEHFGLDAEALLERFLPSLPLVNSQFQRSWIQGMWLHKEAYAQPIATVGHSRNIPPLATPLPGVWWASMSQVYPWDRGTNYAVELGRRAASEMLQQVGSTALRAAPLGKG